MEALTVKMITFCIFICDFCVLELKYFGYLSLTRMRIMLRFCVVKSHSPPSKYPIYGYVEENDRTLDPRSLNASIGISPALSGCRLPRDTCAGPDIISTGRQAENWSGWAVDVSKRYRRMSLVRCSISRLDITEQFLINRSARPECNRSGRSVCLSSKGSRF